MTDFLKWQSFVDVTNAIAISGDRLQWTSAYLDRRDPQRAATGLAYALASYAGNRTSDAVTGATSPIALANAGTPIYELWPHPTSGQAFYVRFRRSGADLLNPTDELPPLIDEGLVVCRALYMHAYPFAAANVANFPTFKGANWINLIGIQKANFDTLWITTVKRDNEQMQSQVLDRGHGLRRAYGGFKGLNDYPIDANFIQTHLVRI